MPDETRELVFRIRVTAPISLNAEEVAGLLEALVDVGYADAADSCDEEFGEMAEQAKMATSLDIGPFEFMES